MYTKWHMVLFLFLGCAGAGILLSAAINFLLRGGGSRRPPQAALAATLSILSIMIFAFSLADPSKIINLLGRPSAGLSSAVISQIMVAVVAIAVFKAEKTKPMAILGIAVALIASVCLGRVYMVVSRPALNTWVIHVIIILIVVQTGLYGQNSEFMKKKQSVFAVLAFACMYGIFLLAFFFRLKDISPSDRLLTFQVMTSGVPALMYWSVIIFSFVLPALISAAAIKGKLYNPSVQRVLYGIGVFAFSCLVNQSPVIIKAINNRF